MDPIIPKHERSNLPLDTENIIHHPDMIRANEWIVTQYKPPVRKICVFVPCSKKKPYHASPSHKMFDSVIFSCLKQEDVHVVTFGTCGVTPRELDEQYPFTEYSFMMGKCNIAKVKADFLRIETKRLEAYLTHTKNNYKIRIAYCIGDFREAMLRASEKTGIHVVIVPQEKTIEQNIQPNKKFIYNSLSCEPYKNDFKKALLKARDEINPKNQKINGTQCCEYDGFSNGCVSSERTELKSEPQSQEIKQTHNAENDIEWYDI